MSAHTRQVLWLAVAALSLAAVVLLVLARMQETAVPGTSKPAPTSPPATLRQAPDFHLRTFQGRAVALSDFRGKAIVLNFWASWCTPCRQEMPNLERAWQEYKNRDVVVLGIDVADDMEAGAEFVRALRITYPVVYDPDQARLNAYQVFALPTTVFIDRNMHIRGRFAGGYLGPEGYNQLQREIQNLLASSP